LPSLCPEGTYFGKLLEQSLKQAKVDGCKPSFQARLRKLVVKQLPTVHIDGISYIQLITRKCHHCHSWVLEGPILENYSFKYYSNELKLRDDASLVSKQD
jgi:hypothetical protein